MSQYTGIKETATGDIQYDITAFKDASGATMALATASEIIIYVKDRKATILLTYKYVDYTGIADRIYADSSTAAHIMIPKAINDAYEGQTLNVCGVWKAINAQLVAGVGEYPFELENYIPRKCQ